MRASSCSHRRDSELVRLFARRASEQGHPDARLAIGMLVGRVRASSNRPKTLAVQLEPIWAARKIIHVELAAGMTCDGFVEPNGTRFDQGFRMVLRREAPESRIRFTIAHEICHTFFYEFVPELKFQPHNIDEQEERLCNLGAAELLIPAASLKRHARNLPVSLDSLEQLATSYAVSKEAMLLRLRSLKLWDCELSVWHRMANGSFALDRLVGGRRIEWGWTEDSPLQKAWDTGHQLDGRTFLECRDGQGASGVRPISYQVVRRGNALIALWSRKTFVHPRRKMPLFEQGPPTGCGHRAHARSVAPCLCG